MARRGVDPAALDAPRASPALVSLLREEVAWARQCFDAGGPLVRRAFTAAAHAAEPSDAPPIREVLVTSVDLGDAIEIEVADSGPWLAEPARAWLAAPSSRRDAAPEHVGLALAAAVAAAERIGGTLTATNCPEGGVAVTLRLPRRQSRRMAA